MMERFEIWASYSLMFRTRVLASSELSERKGGVMKVEMTMTSFLAVLPDIEGVLDGGKPVPNYDFLDYQTFSRVRMPPGNP